MTPTPLRAPKDLGVLPGRRSLYIGVGLIVLSFLGALAAASPDLARAADPFISDAIEAAGRQGGAEGALLWSILS